MTGVSARRLDAVAQGVAAIDGCAERVELLEDACRLAGVGSSNLRAINAAARHLHAQTCPTCRARFDAMPIERQDEERDRLVAAMDAVGA